MVTGNVGQDSSEGLLFSMHEENFFFPNNGNATIACFWGHETHVDGTTANFLATQYGLVIKYIT